MQQQQRAKRNIETDIWSFTTLLAPQCIVKYKFTKNYNNNSLCTHWPRTKSKHLQDFLIQNCNRIDNKINM